MVVPALLAAVLLGVSAAAPQGTAMAPVLSAGGAAAAAFTLGPSAFYTAALGRGTDGEPGVTRYDLPGGDRAWATALPQNVRSLTLDPDSGVLLARPGNGPRMTFLDAADGTILWHLESAATSAVALTGARVLLRSELSDTNTRLTLSDARTGMRVWTRIVDTRSEIANDLSEHPDRIVLVGLDGRVLTLRFADGSVLGDGRLGVRLSSDPAQPRYATAAVAGERLYLSRREREGTSLTAYGLPGLTVRWTAKDVPVGDVHDCGPVLCVAHGHGLSGLDPGNGSVLWTQPAWTSAGVTPDGVLVAYEGANNPESVVIDPRTGAAVERLGHVLTVGGVRLRTDTGRGRTWVSVTDPADGRAHTVGSLDAAVPYGCEVRAPYLACPTVPGPTGVWRLPQP
ncbi:hypothetical protein Asp14428_35210 [Actinoplanes sp. NBRC 14428]|nr:hypothetical protein Asp14428_35210 [Actinoplanes sp. NBRC 14428]